MDTLFYDGQCPLCTREIRQLERLQQGGLALVDVHAYDPAPDEPDEEELLLRLHLRTGEGRWVSGVDATVQAWSHTRWGWLFRPLRWPLIGPVADRVYDYWARRRYDGLYCDDACARPD